MIAAVQRQRGSKVVELNHSRDNAHPAMSMTVSWLTENYVVGCSYRQTGFGPFTITAQECGTSEVSHARQASASREHKKPLLQTWAAAASTFHPTWCKSQMEGGSSCSPCMRQQPLCTSSLYVGVPWKVPWCHLHQVCCANWSPLCASAEFVWESRDAQMTFTTSQLALSNVPSAVWSSSTDASAWLPSGWSTITGMQMTISRRALMALAPTQLASDCQGCRC